MVRKIAAADAVVWLDRVKFTMGGWINRNQLPFDPDRDKPRIVNGQAVMEGPWLSVPVNRDTIRGEIRHVEIADFHGWNRKHARTLRQRYAKAEHFDKGADLIRSLENAWKLSQQLVALNWITTQHLLAGLGVEVRQHWQHDLVAEGANISEKIADMCGLIGASVYLSGPTGRTYLDVGPFRDRHIEVRYFDHEGPNPSAVDAMMRRGTL